MYWFFTLLNLHMHIEGEVAESESAALDGCPERLGFSTLIKGTSAVL